ncbi:hypothetical protein BATDEDRAFT_86059 [Batrachochytrium dendrobatidis JAM81]|uniref:PROP1-like PPR domain-containing protein n=1 Tax=Batrachochytrium dendrobatidis (strain JAM81 / FGSC 10211) TaxID=684364 RepID=F4NV60_BATDJ|nr:uncharacterized protein BATDEDRAFT_86059 [Batrachochytrium dendrobatidis JAM81]EGF83669.1 hypothetical protein BATDEDRAFT_86059 [Batrachochytrium dendrobatidis JAM81]|eukprot:XP_006676183.1 hypothetical protein BATDEDRAFT_86059 [Batrachochytrium dendrobatidis JAM81]
MSSIISNVQHLSLLKQNLILNRFSVGLLDIHHRSLSLSNSSSSLDAKRSTPQHNAKHSHQKHSHSKLKLIKPTLTQDSTLSFRLHKPLSSVNFEHVKPLYKADYEAFSKALALNDKIVSWLKFRDLILDPHQRKRITIEDIKRLLQILSKQDPPKFLAMEDVIRTCSELGLQPTIDMFSILIHAYGSVGKIDYARETIVKMKHAGFEPTIDTYNQFLRIAVNSVSIDLATEMLEKAIKEGYPPNAESYSILMMGCISAKQTEAAQSFYNRMEKEGIIPTAAVHSQVVKMQVINKDLQAIQRIFDRMTEGFIENDPNLCATLISGFCQLDDLESAEKLYTYMQTVGVVPTRGSFGPLVRSKINNGELDKALAILHTSDSMLGGIDISLHFEFIGYASHVGHTDCALAHTDLLLSRGTVPTIGVFCALIDGLTAQKRSNEAYAMFDELQEKGIRPTIALYNAVLKAAAVDSDISMIRKLWGGLQHQNSSIAPNKVTFEVTLGAYVAAGDIISAMSTLDSMSKAELHPSPEIYASLILACIYARKYTEASKVIVRMRKIGHTQNILMKPILQKYQSQLENCIIESAKEFVKPGANSISEKATVEDSKEAANLAHSYLLSPQSVLIDKLKSHCQIVLELYQEFSQHNLVLCEEALCQVMVANHRENDLVSVVRVWTQLFKSKENPKAESVTILIQAAADLGQERTAKAIQAMIDNDKLALNIDGYQALLRLLARGGMGEEVIQAMFTMMKAGHSLTPEIYRDIKHAFAMARPLNPVAQKVVADFVEEYFPEVMIEDIAKEKKERSFRVTLLPDSIKAAFT